ncbi:G-type lectin S-receptor-like serine/threonine-protein kinase CES101 [Cornus florida]|uniref:G-type lectin S-receptor-like serine/threonine-protein kinase CES101 n=1 Tax=Cornus florida TaxID=4283 RepID=UPI0028980030|nr:G-type lectin S-receptor-like serine/threonine-protein kinase CES101 [Cornus florida]
MLLLVCAFLCFWGFDSSLVAGESTIQHGDELNSSGSLLVSESRYFTLGFFNTTMTASSYLGIWYTYGDKIRIVWVANPNTPILNNFGVLTIDSKGRLKLMSGGSTLVNVSDQVGTGNVSATLEDSGNFVVMDETENRILWQSFDHPGSTLLQASDGYYFTFSVGDERMLWNLIPDGRIVDGSAFVLTPHEFCHGYQSDDGCVNTTVPECRSHGDTFQ